MKPLPINRIAFGAALIIHALLLSLGALVPPVHPEPEEQIAIRFTSLREREAPATSQAVEPLVREVEPAPVVENQDRVTGGGAPLLPSREPARQPESPPVLAPVPAPASQARVEPVPAVAPAQSAPQAAAAPFARSAPQGVAARPAPPAQQKHEAPAAAAKPSPRLADYLAVVRGVVENNREYPPIARQMRLTGTVTVRVSIRGDGSIEEVAVAASAGHKSLDKAAVSAVRRAAPFKPPGAFGLGEVTVEIPIVYRLT